MPGFLRKVFTTWGIALAIIPFIILVIYGAIVVSDAVGGATRQSFSSFALTTGGIFVLSLFVFVGLAILLVWYDEKKSGGVT